MKRSLAVLSLLGVGLTLASAAPASAADNATQLRNSNGVLIGKATWDDSHDNLCVRSFVKGHKVTATLSLLDGSWGPVHVSDSGHDSKPNCTGNLSIPEDERAFLILGDSNRSVDDTFYT